VHLDRQLVQERRRIHLVLGLERRPHELFVGPRLRVEARRAVLGLPFTRLQQQRLALVPFIGRLLSRGWVEQASHLAHPRQGARELVA
jgi:hypothetical protein